jgi:hypothetical protein
MAEIGIQLDEDELTLEIARRLPDVMLDEAFGVELRRDERVIRVDNQIEVPFLCHR